MLVTWLNMFPNALGNLIINEDIIISGEIKKSNVLAVKKIIDPKDKVLNQRSVSINSNYAIATWATDMLFWYEQYDPLGGDRKVYIGLHGLEGCEEEAVGCNQQGFSQSYEEYGCQ
uniref:SCP domain-containing protein n=1 Tax=Meloidogyne hapla TaxID=6305 RepID=A0A1I8AZM5_MELHA